MVELDNSKGRNVLCCCVYRHPYTELTKFSDHLREMLSVTDKENKTVYIMGDCNANLIDDANYAPTNDFINMIFSHHLQPSVIHPTRITDSTSTLIDNIFVTNFIGQNIQSGNILSLISDHLPQFCIISDFIYEYIKLRHFSHDYSNFDVYKFLSDYVERDTSFLVDKSIGLGDKFGRFLFNLHSLINKHWPQKRLNKKRLRLRNKPWINQRILKMMRIGDMLCQQFKSTKSAADLKAFKLFRNRVVNELKDLKRNYYHRYYDANKSNMKMPWKGIKSVVS